jgi:hypothetical protein
LTFTIEVINNGRSASWQRIRANRVRFSFFSALCRSACKHTRNPTDVYVKICQHPKINLPQSSGADWTKNEVFLVSLLVLCVLLFAEARNSSPNAMAQSTDSIELPDACDRAAFRSLQILKRNPTNYSMPLQLPERRSMSHTHTYIYTACIPHARRMLT